MKATLEIPEPLYLKAKIRAMERGTSLGEILIQGLERELSDPAPSRTAGAARSYWANRKLRPGFKAAWESGALSGGTDSNRIISEGRDEG